MLRFHLPQGRGVPFEGLGDGREDPRACVVETPRLRQRARHRVVQSRAHLGPLPDRRDVRGQQSGEDQQPDLHQVLERPEEVVDHTAHEGEPDGQRGHGRRLGAAPCRPPR